MDTIEIEKLAKNNDKLDLEAIQRLIRRLNELEASGLIERRGFQVQFPFDDNAKSYKSLPEDPQLNCNSTWGLFRS